MNGHRVIRVARSDWSTLDASVANLSKSWEEFENSITKEPVTAPKSRQQLRQELCQVVEKDFRSRWHSESRCNRFKDTSESKLGPIESGPPTLTDKEFLGNLTNCSLATEYFQTIPKYTSLEEIEFPLAYVLIFTYKETMIQQYMKQLAFLYRDHNVYCVHVDRRGPEWWIAAIQKLTKCFPNIVYVDDPVKVWFRHWSQLEAQLRCYSILLELDTPLWEYGMTLKGVELPLVTNREMVNYLKTQKRRVIIPKGQSATSMFSKPIIQDQATYKTCLRQGMSFLTDDLLPPVPPEIQLFRSKDESVGVAVPNDFVEFMLSDDRAIDLREYLKLVQGAEDFFYQTVNHFSKPGAPGRTIVHAKTSGIIAKNTQVVCPNILLQDNCTMETRDIPELVSLSERKDHFFCYKYLISHDQAPMLCLEEKLQWRNRQEYLRDCRGVAGT